MPWQNNSGGDDRGPWGKGPSGGGQEPPNIEDLIRKGQSQLRDVMPGGLGSKGILLILLVLIGGWLATGFYRVNADEQGVVLRFGKWVNTTTPGLNYHLPSPIETVLLPKVTVINQIDIGFQGANNAALRRNANVQNERQMLTGDENIIEIEFSVFWRIADAGMYLFNVENPPQTVKAVAESVMREIIGKTPIQEALTEGRQRIELEAQNKLQSVLNGYGAGVVIEQVKLTRVDPPAAVIDSFRDVQKAQADRERKRNEAEAYQNDIVPRARGDAERMYQEAQAYREEVIAKATGEASRFLAVYNEYKQAKDVTRKRIYLETMEEIMGGMNKVIVDGNSGSGVLPYLPLPELQKKAN